MKKVEGLLYRPEGAKWTHVWVRRMFSDGGVEQKGQVWKIRNLLERAYYSGYKLFPESLIGGDNNGGN